MREGPDEPQDELEIEITSLGESKPAGLAPGSLHLFARRHKRPLTAVAVGMGALAVLLIVVSTFAVRGLVARFLVPPTPTPAQALYPGEDLFYVQADTVWGHLTVDGRGIPRLPIVGVTAPLRLARGQHELVWSAEPFLPQGCTLSVPPNYLIDTCVDHSTVQTHPGVSASIVEFQESLTTLAPDRRAALIQAVQKELDARQSTDIVQPGEHYVLAADSPACSRNGAQGYQCYATSNRPLRATLNFRLDANEASNENCIDIQPGNCTLNYQNCRLFCGGPSTASSSTREWDVVAPVLSLWTFATMDGQVLARNVPDDSAFDYATGQTLDESLAQLRITWDSLNWHVAVSVNMDSQGSGFQGTGYFDPVCAAMTQQVTPLNPPVAANGETLYLQWQFASGTLPAAGCLAVGTSKPEDGLTTPTPSHVTTPVFYYLHRFGVLLAVNRLAQSDGLLLPLADAYEQELAQQLARGINSNA